MTLAKLPFAALSLLSVLSAQTPPKPVDIGSELEDILNTDQIQAASKRVQDVASAPADVVVILGRDLKALGYRTLGDALGGVLGFRTNEDHAYQGMGMGGVYILGDQNTRLLVLLDGHALNSPAEVGSSKVGEDFGIPLELVDHIEVVRGPASSLYGNNAFQALVNVSTVFAAGTAPSAFQGAATSGTEGMGELWASGTFNLGGAKASLMASGFRRPGTALTFPELQAQALPADADREDRQSAYLHVLGGEWSFTGAMLSRTQGLASGPFGSVPGDTGNRYGNRRLSADLKWEPRTDQVKWMFRLFGDQNTFTDAFVTPGPGGNSRSWDSDPDRSMGLEAQGRVALAPHVSVTFGTELQQHRYNGAYTSDVDGSAVGNDVAYATGNTYLEGNWDPTAAWTLVAGLQRADWIPSQVDNVIGGVRQGLPKASISHLTPRFSAIWRPQEDSVVKAIFGQGFRFPTIFERYYTDAVAIAANPSIQPEVITSSQLSWSRSWTPRLKTHVAATLLSCKDSITQGSTGNMSQYQNSPDLKRGRTVEMEASWRLGATELSGGAGWYDWTMKDQPLDNTSRWTGVFKAIRREGPWSLAGEARYVDARSAHYGDLVSTVPANWTLRTSLRLDTGKFWAQASLEDLTNSRRRDLVAPEYDPVTWMAANGRTLRATVGIRL